MIQDDGTDSYSLQSVHSSKYIDVSGVSTANGANIHQWSYFGNDNQRWKLIHLQNGEYNLEAVHSGRSAVVSGGSVNEGASIIQWDHNPTRGSMNWRLIEISSGTSARAFIPIEVEEDIKDMSLMVYPNPVEDLLIIQSIPEDANLSISDLQGRKVINQSGNQVDVSRLDSGVYILSVAGEAKKLRFIKH